MFETRIVRCYLQTYFIKYLFPSHPIVGKQCYICFNVETHSNKIYDGRLYYSVSLYISHNNLSGTNKYMYTHSEFASTYAYDVSIGFE